ncbi:hypothetical protein GCM10023195_59480 [Actinoallomurus liliacearum]|uniref:Uncharacterized protein n=1 Tax=Actinoallomurus liliacearum TaxID=1080073 RepID=A0ABP8TQ49_9ACTN
MSAIAAGAMATPAPAIAPVTATAAAMLLIFMDPPEACGRGKVCPVHPDPVLAKIKILMTDIRVNGRFRRSHVDDALSWCAFRRGCDGVAKK